MPDINIGAITEALNDKMDRDANNIESPKLPIFLVDVQYPTAENNYTWYRKYSDGWVEQGGHSSSGTQPRSVAFAITMANTDYCVFYGDSNVGLSSLTNSRFVKTYIKSTTGFQATGVYQNGTNSDYEFDWKVEGMSAS